MAMFGLFGKSQSISAGASALQTGCFGKLPIHQDFIRHNLKTRETGAFEKWVQEGVANIARRHPKGWPAVYRFFPVHHFVLSGCEQEAGIIGSLAASRDKSGRVYPFATLAAITDAVFQANRATLPLVHKEFFRQSNALIATAPGMPSVSALTRGLDELNTDPPLFQQRELLERQIRLLETVALGDYWKSLSIPVEDREQFWWCFYDLMKTAQTRGPCKTHWGIRIPIPSEADQTPFVVFWVQMVESILEDRFWRAQYFWNRQSETCDAALTLFFRPLPPSYLLPLLNQALDDNAIIDLGRECSSLPAYNSRVDLRRLLENDDIPLLEVLYRTGRREMLR